MSRAAIAVQPRLEHPLAMFHLPIALGLVLLSSPSLAEPKAMAPAGKWMIDFADQQCVAAREFGTADDMLHLAIKPSPGSEVVQVSLISNGNNAAGVQNDVQIAFDGDPPIRIKELQYGVQKKRARMINLTAEQADRMSSATSMDWLLRGTDRRLEIGSMTTVMKLLADCKKDLRAYWNAGLEESDFKKAPKALKPLSKYFVSTDYPQQAWSAGDTGTTSVVMLIDEKGKLADCMVDATSGIPTIDAMTCLVLRQRAEYSPGIDANGKPARSMVAAKIKWQLP